MAVLLAAGCNLGTGNPLAAARALQDEGRLEDSIEPLRRVLAEQPEHPEANYLLGHALLRTGRLTPAIWPLRKAARSDAFGAMAGPLLAHALLSSGNDEQAREVADEILAAAPRDLAALELRGRANLSAGRFEELLADAERILAIDPQHTRGRQLQAVALSELGRWDEAEAVLVEMSVAASDDPDLAARSCVALAAVREKAGEAARAEAEFLGCVDSFPSNLLVLDEAAAYHLRQRTPERAGALWRGARERVPDSLAIRLRLAAHLEQRGDLDGARRVQREAAEEFGSPHAWEALAELHRRRGEFEIAAGLLEKALAGGVRSERLAFQRAALLVDAGDWARAESLAEDFGESAFRDFIRGRIRLARGDPRAALDALEAGLARWPDNAAARTAAGRAAQELGDGPRALEHYRQALRVDAGSRDVAYTAARLAQALGRFDEAADFARAIVPAREARDRPLERAEPLLLAIEAARAAARDTEARGYEGILMARARHGDPVAVAALARLARSRGDLEAAARIVEESGLDLTDPANETALRELVGVRVGQDRTALALAEVERAIARSADVAALHDLHARVLAALDRREEAQAAFERALAVESKHAPSLAGLGALHVQAGNLPGALDAFERAVAADPRDADSAYRAAQIVRTQGDRAAAERRLRAVVALAPEHAGASNDFAWLLAESGRELDLALDLARRAVRASPPLAADVADTLAFVQLAREDASGAVATLEPVVAAHPGSGTLQYRLGIAYAQLGDREAALSAFRAALADDAFANGEDARERISRLEAARKTGAPAEPPGSS